MRRALSIIALALTGAAFILLCLISVLRIKCDYTCSDVCGSNHPAWDMQKNACQTSNRH